MKKLLAFLFVFVSTIITAAPSFPVEEDDSDYEQGLTDEWDADYDDDEDIDLDQNWDDTDEYQGLTGGSTEEPEENEEATDEQVGEDSEYNAYGELVPKRNETQGKEDRKRPGRSLRSDQNDEINDLIDNHYDDDVDSYDELPDDYEENEEVNEEDSFYEDGEYDTGDEYEDDYDGEHGEDDYDDPEYDDYQ